MANVTELFLTWPSHSMVKYGILQECFLSIGMTIRFP